MPNTSNDIITVITNITLQPFFEMHLKKFFAEDGISVKLNYISFNEYLSEEHIEKIINADRIIVWLNIEYLYPNLINDLAGGTTNVENIERNTKDEFVKLYLFIKEKCKKTILWIGVEDYCYHSYYCCLGHRYISKGLADRINITLNKVIEEDDIYVDFKSIIARLGVEQSFDSKSKYRWNTPYSRELLCDVASEVHKQYLICQGVTKKCVVLDCDNVLWGGILSEDGIEGIQLGNSGLGRPYQDFGRFMLSLYYHGVIIAICSKNDKRDVLRVFREHKEMILKEENVACFCINWGSKVDNIKAIAEMLNIGLDSMIFIDDSDFEVQAVATLLPTVTAIKFESNNIYKHFACFNLKSSVDVDKVQKRSLTFQTNELRINLKQTSSSFDEYLKALEMNVDIHVALPIELARIAELTQRTNKCTNGRRYTTSQLKEKLEIGYGLYSVSLSDKFADLGIVGAIGIDGNALDLFSLSCRALGRNIEEIMIDFIRENNITRIYTTSTHQNFDLCSKLNGLLKQ